MAVVPAFNNHFEEFLEDVRAVFPENADIASACQSLKFIRQSNPRLIVKIWKSSIASKYRDQIMNGDISFFLDKDYSADIQSSSNTDMILAAIDRLRGPVSEMSPSNQAKVMTYIRNLTSLSDMV